jgi:hypothetical protein
MCFVWIAEQTMTFAFTTLADLFCVTQLETVYCAARTESLYKADMFCLQRATAKYSRRTPTRELRVDFDIQYVYGFHYKTLQAASRSHTKS